MFLEFVIPATVILFFSYNTLPKFKHGVDVNIQKTRALLNEVTRADHCVASKQDRCPMTSHKQCTNNMRNQQRCDCSDPRSYEVCSKQYHGVDMPHKATPAFNHGKYATRVNMYTTADTAFNNPNKLNIRRANPYVSN
jgi:hypothetical protein